MAHVGCVRCWTKDSKGQPPLKVRMSHSHVVKVEKHEDIKNNVFGKKQVHYYQEKVIINKDCYSHYLLLSASNKCC